MRCGAPRMRCVKCACLRDLARRGLLRAPAIEASQLYAVLIASFACGQHLDFRIDIHTSASRKRPRRSKSDLASVLSRTDRRGGSPTSPPQARPELLFLNPGDFAKLRRAHVLSNTSEITG